MKVIDFLLVVIFSYVTTLGIAQNSSLEKYSGSLQKINILDRNELEQTKKYLTTSLKLFPEDSLVINYLLAAVYHFEDRFKESQDLLNDLIISKQINNPEFKSIKRKADEVSVVNNLYLGNSLIAKKNVDGDDDYIKLQNFIKTIKISDELSRIKFDSLQMLILHVKNFRNPHSTKKLNDFVKTNHNINCRIIKSMLLNEKDSTFLLLNEAINFYPNKAEYYYQKGILAGRFVKYKEYALSSFNSAINLDGNQAKYFYERAFYCRYNFEYDNEKELQDINRAIFLNPENVDYYSLRYSYYERYDNFEEALIDLNILIKLDPDSKLYYIRDRALLNFKLDNKIEYNRDYKSILESKDTSMLIRLLKSKGIYLRYIKKYDLAISDFKYASELDKFISEDQIDHQDFNYLISDCYKKLKNYSLALEYLEKSIYKFNYYDKADLLILSNRNIEALEIINKVLLDNTANTASFYYLRSICKFKLGDKQGALTDIQNAIELSENVVPWFLSQRAIIYNEFKKYDLEIEDLTIALNMTKNQRILREDENYEKKITEFYQRRGKANLALNLKVRACYDFSEALNYNVNNLEVLELIKSYCK